MKNLLIILCCLLGNACFAQSDNHDAYGQQWTKADSLLMKGLPRSTEAIVKAIYAQAKEAGDADQMLKARIYLLQTKSETRESGDTTAISAAVLEAKNASFPLKNIWHSIAAELYWRYYQNNRYEILQRTRIAGGTAGRSITEWDTRTFFETIARHYRLSLKQPEALMDIPVRDYKAVVIPGENTDKLRPSLYDLLAFRAVSYFESDEKEIIRPAFEFKVNDPAMFKSAASFAKQDFKTDDTLSGQYAAVKLYQQIIALHLDDAAPDALLDADLQRLAFVYNHGAMPGKQELYQKALQRIIAAYPDHPLTALAAYRIVVLKYGEEGGYGYYRKRAVVKDTTDLVALRRDLQQIITRFPNSEGSVLAQQRLNGIMTKELSMQVEEVVLPNEPAKFLLQYRNIPEVHFRILPLGSAERLDGDSISILLKRSIPVQEWSNKLPATGDLKAHSAEVKMDGLKTGRYLLVVSMNEAFDTGRNIMAQAIFQISRIALITNNNAGPKNAFVLDRKTGGPLAGATVRVYRNEYNARRKGTERILRTTETTRTDGSFDLPAVYNNSINEIEITNKGDFFSTDAHLNFSERQVNNNKDTAALIFTDRSIYRPGQTVYYKAILFRPNGDGWMVCPKTASEMKLADVNNTTVSNGKFVTNDFGSYAGSFVIPDRALTGEWTLSDDHGEVHIQVEEYKRPKFEIAWDSVKPAYVLGDALRIPGRAIAYAGNTISGATVKYTVVRTVAYPFYDLASKWGMPYVQEQQLASGTITTDASGKFTIPFVASPDSSVPVRSMPSFSYAINVDITDLNGETRSSTTNVSVGYHSIALAVDFGYNAKQVPDKMLVTSKNLNDVFVPADVRVQIHQLQQPEWHRPRLWEAPDQFIIDSVTFKKLFPQDAYRAEVETKDLPVVRTMLDTSYRTKAGGIAGLSQSAFPAGGNYKVVVTTTGKNGVPVVFEQIISIPEERQEPITVDPGIKNESGKRILHITIRTRFDNAYIVQQIANSTDVNIQAFYVNDRSVSYQRALQQGADKALILAYVLIKDNRIYKVAQQRIFTERRKYLDVVVAAHRDKAEPGSKQTWSVTIKGAAKERAAVELVASMYDASLDQLKPHDWLDESAQSYETRGVLHYNDPFTISVSWTGEDFEAAQGYVFLNTITSETNASYQKIYPELLTPTSVRLIIMNRFERRGSEGSRRIVDFKNPTLIGGVKTTNMFAEVQKSRAPGYATPPQGAIEQVNNADMTGGVPARYGDPSGGVKSTPIFSRRNLRETAFFFPQLRTDAAGNIKLEFTLPEALTKWKMLAFAHTRDMTTGFLTDSIITQKSLMVQPNLPRFLRQGDEVVISAKISNLTAKALTGTASLELLDAQSMRNINTAFGMSNSQVSFTADKAGSTVATWGVRVPESRYEPVVVRITAGAGNFTDGEENTLPVLSNRTLVTETLPLWMNGGGSKTFSFDKLLHSDTARTLSNYRLTVEYTANPAWYAVQALPYLMEYPYECAEQTFNRYYANALAAHILAQAPRVKQVFSQWKTSDTAALLSNLEKNQELKSALLEETPWVLDAKDESASKRNIARLFDSYRLAAGQSAALPQLNELIVPDGGFPWFKGGTADRYITQYIATGLARLHRLGVEDKQAVALLARLRTYLDAQLARDYSNLLKSKAKPEDQHITNLQVQYLYARSFEKSSGTPTAALNYYQTQAARYWHTFNPYLKAMIATALQRAGDETTAANIRASLKETSLSSEALGTYWKENGSSYWWYEAPVEAQSNLIECFEEINDKAMVDGMKRWLLKQKQTTNWPTTKATADACYALLLSGTQWLATEPAVTIRLGDKTITPAKAEAGTGYFKQAFNGKDVTADMGTITISNKQAAGSDMPSYGAVYWQYFERYDKITTAATPLALRKQLFIERTSDRGPVLEEIKVGNELKVGDRVKVRIVLQSDRDMEYLHLKDMRAAAFEPTATLSGYKYQAGLSYYESPRDASSNFFIDYLRRGTYVFEYSVNVMAAGTFSNGISTIQCMYAPEFTSHSEGLTVTVKP